MTLPKTSETAGRMNPTLIVDAFFAADVDGDYQKTKFNLRTYPEMASWVLSILDHVLCQQGRLPGERPIAEPPGGPARQLLMDGRVLFAHRRPDGVLELRLNPKLDVKLQLYARRLGLRAHYSLLPLLEDVELTRWLLTRYPVVSPEGFQAPPAESLPAEPLPAEPLPEPLVSTLRRHGVLVDALPPADACFPDPGLPVDLAAELAPASLIFAQPAGAAIPGEVRRILGRHVPEVPADTGLIWSQDAGTGMVYPTRWTPGESPLEIERVTGTGAAARVAFWDRQRAAARLSLQTRRYATLRDILPPAQREKLRRYVRQLVERGYFPALGDGQVDLRAAIHNQPTVAALHQGLAGIVNSFCPEPVIASYCYLSCYEEGAVLDRHKDRKQCAYNLSLVLDMQGPAGEPEPWPIYMEIDGTPEAVQLQVGDGLCYSGTDIWHWRDALPKGQRAIVCFYHFVPQDFTGSLD